MVIVTSVPSADAILPLSLKISSTIFFIRLHNRISKNVDCIKINNLHFQPFRANIRTFGTVKVHFAVDTGSGVPSAVRDICVVCNDFQFICSGNDFSSDVNKKFVYP